MWAVASFIELAETSFKRPDGTPKSLGMVPGNELPGYFQSFLWND
jgi:hypothetical protein